MCTVALWVFNDIVPPYILVGLKWRMFFNNIGVILFERMVRGRVAY